MDVPDVGPFRNMPLEEEVAPGSIYSSRLSNSKYYNFDHPKRGKALIFDNSTFDDKDLQYRHGSDKDSKNLEKVLKIMGFDVIKCLDFTKDEIDKQLEDVASLDHKENDCLVVIALSHGNDQGEAHAKDKPYNVSNLWNSFTGKTCPSLIGKPKLFFLQACRGEQFDLGVPNRRVQIETDSAINENREIFVIPTLADILIMYSTTHGFYSYRNREKGSWFIQELCNQLEQYYKTTDLLSILTFVIGAVAYGKQTITSNEKNSKKQLPHINSQLTKLLYFMPTPEKPVELQREASIQTIPQYAWDNNNRYFWVFLIVLALILYVMSVNYIFCVRN